MGWGPTVRGERMSTEANGMAFPHVGRPIKRLEDPTLITGSDRYGHPRTRSAWYTELRSQITQFRILSVGRTEDASVAVERAPRSESTVSRLGLSS